MQGFSQKQSEKDAFPRNTVLWLVAQVQMIQQTVQDTNLEFIKKVAVFTCKICKVLIKASVSEEKFYQDSYQCGDWSVVKPKLGNCSQ